MFRETAGQKRQLFGRCYVKNLIYQQSAIFIINPVRRQSGNQPPR